MPSCTVRYSAEVAVDAAHAFFWRKFRSQIGAVYLASFVLIPAFMFLYAHYAGVDWFVGAMGTIFVLNLGVQASYYFAVPKALAKLAETLEPDGLNVETTSDGIKVTSGQSVNAFRWKEFKHIWIYDSFVIFVIGIPLANRFLHVPTTGMTDDVREAIQSAATHAVA